MNVIWTRSTFYPAFIRSPAERQGDEKLVYRLIQLFSSTEIFSKRRKIYACWRKTRVNCQTEEPDLRLSWCCKTCGTNNRTSTFVSMRKNTYIPKRLQSLLPLIVRRKRATKALGTTLKRLRLITVPRPIWYFCHEAEKKWVWRVTTLLYRCCGNRLPTKILSWEIDDESECKLTTTTVALFAKGEIFSTRFLFCTNTKLC